MAANVKAVMRALLKIGLFLAMIAVTTAVSKRDLHLIPDDIRSALGISLAVPVPSQIIIAANDESYLIFPNEIDLSYEWNEDSLVPSFSKEKLDEEISRFADLIYRPPRDAILNLIDLSVLPEVPGRMLGKEATLANVTDLINRSAYDEIAHAVFSEISAKVTAEQIGRFDPEPIGEYTTKFKSWQHNRNYNIALCASFFNGMIIFPGQEISFNDVTGDRTYSTGYKSAPVIEKQEIVPGVGGGSCQVSTTLYNAACLEAGLAIIERWPHGLQVGYVPWNRDATVAFPGRDFKFENTYNSPVMIISEIDGNKITFRLYAWYGAENLISEELEENSGWQRAKIAPPRPKPKPEPEPELESSDAGSTEPSEPPAEPPAAEPPPEPEPDPQPDPEPDPEPEKPPDAAGRN